MPVGLTTPSPERGIGSTKLPGNRRKLGTSSLERSQSSPSGYSELLELSKLEKNFADFEFGAPKNSEPQQSYSECTEHFRETVLGDNFVKSFFPVAAGTRSKTRLQSWLLQRPKCAQSPCKNFWARMRPCGVGICSSGSLTCPLWRERGSCGSSHKEFPPIHGSRRSHGSPYRAFERLYLTPWKSWKSRKYKTVLKALLQHFLETKSS